jgi:hypothetical protein
LTYSFQNLQDFVLNLLNDPAAQTAYAADPTAALSDAGLGDLTPQDVQEVIPLVTDALPSDTPVGDLAIDTTGLMDGSDTLGGSLGAANGLGELGAWGEQTADGGVAVWGGSASDLLGRVAGGMEVSPDGLAAAATTPLGYTDFDTNGNSHFVPADPTDMVANLGDTGDAVAGTMTHMVSSGASTLAGAVDSGGDTLEGLLAGTPAESAAHGVESATDMVSADVQGGAGMMAQQVSDLPGTDALPVDHLPALPDLPEVPNLGGLPVQVPSLDSLPVNLGDLQGGLGGLSHTLPALPDTGAVTDVVQHNPVTDVVSHSPAADVLQHNPVTDAVSHSPVGGLTDSVHGATDHLPVVGDVTDHLDLGL